MAFDIKVDRIPNGVKVTLIDGRPLLDFTLDRQSAERFAALLRQMADPQGR